MLVASSASKSSRLTSKRNNERSVEVKYRPFGKLDWTGSALGFGCMWLPTVGDDRFQIDEPEAMRMLHYAIDHGANYLDSAYGYHWGSGCPWFTRRLVRECRLRSAQYRTSCRFWIAFMWR